MLLGGFFGEAGVDINPDKGYVFIFVFFVNAFEVRLGVVGDGAIVGDEDDDGRGVAGESCFCAVEQSNGWRCGDGEGGDQGGEHVIV